MEANLQIQVTCFRATASGHTLAGQSNVLTFLYTFGYCYPETSLPGTNPAIFIYLWRV